MEGTVPGDLQIDIEIGYLRKRIPDPGAALCNFAVAAQDRSAAKEALAKIGQDWDPAIWKERKYFDTAVAWIMWEPKHP